MKTVLRISVLTFLLVVPSNPCFALVEIENVTKERAKELGIEVRANAAGPDLVRVELELAAAGELKSYTRVDLILSEGEKLIAHASLREESSKPGRVVVGFAAARAQLDKMTLRVVVQPSPRTIIGYDVPVKDFVELKKVR